MFTLIGSGNDFIHELIDTQCYNLYGCHIPVLIKKKKFLYICSTC
jgi:hypothetical protein